ncbi:DNA helicase [Tanacetum coccineum]
MFLHLFFAVIGGCICIVNVLFEARNANPLALAASFESLSAYGGNSDSLGVYQLLVFPHATQELFRVDGNARPRSNTALKEVPADASGCVSHNYKTDADSDVFNRYSQLHARNIVPQLSPDLSQRADAASFEDSDVFNRYHQLCARKVKPQFSSNSSQLENGSSCSPKNHPDFDVFEKYFHLCAQNVTPRFSANFLGAMIGSSVENMQAINNESTTSVPPILVGDNVNTIENTPSIHNEVTNSIFLTIEDSGHAGTDDLVELCVPMGKVVVLPTMSVNILLTHYPDYVTWLHGYVISGDYDQQCRYCLAPFWYEERLKGHSNRRRPEYHLCCGGGKSICHRHLNCLSEAASLDPTIVEGLLHFLNAHNELVQLFRTTRDKCREIDILEFKIRLYNAKGARGYELPTSNTLGAIFFDSGPRWKALPTIRGLYDVISRGERDGHEVGGRRILPMPLGESPSAAGPLWPPIDKLQNYLEDTSKHWTKYWKETSHDIPDRVLEMAHIPNYHLNDSDVQGYVLYEIEMILKNCSKSLQHFGLPAPPVGLLTQLENRLLMEERNYNREELMQERHDLVPKLNDEQIKIYDLIIHANMTYQQELLFFYGHGGTGKTFLWKTVGIKRLLSSIEVTAVGYDFYYW